MGLKANRDDFNTAMEYLLSRVGKGLEELRKELVEKVGRVEEACKNLFVFKTITLFKSFRPIKLNMFDF